MTEELRRRLTVPLVEDMFTAVLSAAMEEPVIVTGQGVALPETPCCSIRFREVAHFGHGVADFSENPRTGEMEEFAREEARCRMEITFWGNGSMERARRAAALLANNRRVFDLWAVLGFSETGPIRARGKAFLETYRERATFDLYFYAAFGTTYSADYFTSGQFGLKLPEKPYREDMILPNRS